MQSGNSVTSIRTTTSADRRVNKSETRGLGCSNVTAEIAEGRERVTASRKF